MERLVVLLTIEHIEIFYSQHKHIIIKGGFCCEKAIAAAAMLGKKCQTLQKHEKLFSFVTIQEKCVNKFFFYNNEHTQIT